MTGCLGFALKYFNERKQRRKTGKRGGVEK